MKPVIKPIDTRTDLKKAIDNILHDLPTEMERIALQARLAKEQFDCLIKQGFNEQQAMQIVTTQPSWK